MLPETHAMGANAGGDEKLRTGQASRSRAD